MMPAEATNMRIALGLFLGLLATAGNSSADAILYSEGADADLSYDAFASSYYGAGYYGIEVLDDGALLFHAGFADGEFGADAGPLFSTTVETDTDGNPVKTVYRYGGGLFDMSMRFDGGPSGHFEAPIVTLTVTEVEFDVMLSLELGPGLFDAEIADFLGIRRRTRGGLVTDNLLSAGVFGPEPTHFASEGAPTIRIDVPEPSSAVLFCLGAVGLFRRRRRNSVCGS
jgi:hypothetical protein